MEFVKKSHIRFETLSNQFIYFQFYTLKNVFSLLLIEFQNQEISRWERKVGELTGRVSELEDNLSKAQRELSRAQDTNSKLQRDLRENVAQKEDQVIFNSIKSLKSRYKLFSYLNFVCES